MKKTILITCILIFISMNVKIFGQDLIIQVDSEPVSTEAGTDGKIEVIVNAGEPEYTYFLYDNEPWQNANLIEKSGPAFRNSYVFENLPAGRYFAGVIDNSGMSTFKEVFINELKAKDTEYLVDITKNYFSDRSGKIYKEKDKGKVIDYIVSSMERLLNLGKSFRKSEYE